MKSSVKITANPETKEVFTLNVDENGKPKLSKDGRRFGYIRLEQLVADMSGGVISAKNRSALKSISEDDYNKLKEMLVEGTSMKGSIRRIETLKPEGEFSWKEKRAGSDENAPVCTLNGKPIYQRTEFIENVIDVEDELIQHDNTDEIKAFQAETQQAHALNKK